MKVSVDFIIWQLFVMESGRCSDAFTKIHVSGICLVAKCTGRETSQTVRCLTDHMLNELIAEDLLALEKNFNGYPSNSAVLHKYSRKNNKIA